jgi:hypothetical protein
MMDPFIYLEDMMVKLDMEIYINAISNQVYLNGEK